MRARPVDSWDACPLELYAYLEVASLAEDLGRDSDVLSVALADLRDQLEDCLDAADGSSSGLEAQGSVSGGISGAAPYQ